MNIQNNQLPILYNCCYCKKEFLAKDKIDGYTKGYKVGFLCPHCGKNIKDDETVIAKRMEKSFILFLVSAILFSLLDGYTIKLFSHTIEFNYLLYFFITMMVCFIFLIYSKKDPLPQKTTPVNSSSFKYLKTRPKSR